MTFLAQTPPKGVNLHPPSVFIGLFLLSSLSVVYCVYVLFVYCVYIYVYCDFCLLLYTHRLSSLPVVYCECICAGYS